MMLTKSENTREQTVLAVLIVLTGVVYWSLELGDASKLKTLVVIAAMALKFLGVAISFMGLDHAHRAWRLLAMAFVAMISALYLFSFL